MLRRPFIAGNWKMNTERDTAIALAKGVVESSGRYTDRDVMIAPPFPFLTLTRDVIKGSNVFLGAQNMHWDKEGAYTGEVSAGMLKSIPCSHVILGHSERRQIFGETDQVIQKKMERALESGLIPILCVGESAEERESGKTFEVIQIELREGLRGLHGKISNGTEFILAYEPVWAIGTGKNATPEEAQEVHLYLRSLLRGLIGDGASERLRILYGGSVNPSNIDELMAQPDIDGVLVGGASLSAEKFSRIMGFKW